MQIAWLKGGEADVVAAEDDRVSVLSTVPSAPGSRPEGAIQTTGTAVKLKVARCRREGDHFLIEGRLIDATRETRAEVQGLAPAGTG